MGNDRRFNFSHYLLGVRLDNWLRLLNRCGWRLDREKLPQALLISAVSTVLAPFALLETLVCAAPIALAKPREDPVFILGHWRSGTTFLQNLMTRDPQFGWADPVGTCEFSNAILLGWLLRGGVGAGLKNARPMDNVRYSLDLPMEESFALANFTPYVIDHMIAFPSQYEYYLKTAFPDELPPRDRRAWERAYGYMTRKLTLLHGGKRLLFKSPDNTARLDALMAMYPKAKFVNIHRAPCVTIQSTIHMFTAQMDLLRLTPLPDVDMQERMEDVIIGLFERMYRRLFELESAFAPGQYVSVAYEAFTQDPEAGLREIYRALELDGFEEALPRFRAFLEEQKGYRKNSFAISDRLRGKIDARLGFYREHYGYGREE